MLLAGTLLGIALSFGFGDEIMSSWLGGLASLNKDDVGSRGANLGGTDLAALDFHDGAPLLLVPPAGTNAEWAYWPTSVQRQWQSIEWPDGPPLPSAALERSFTPPATLAEWCPWAQAAAALDHNVSLSIVVIGGSVTIGSAECGSFPRGCSWSMHVAEWLARMRPLWRLSVRNIAVSGCGAQEWAHDPIPGPVDVLIIDTTANAFFLAT